MRFKLRIHDNDARLSRQRHLSLAHLDRLGRGHDRRRGNTIGGYSHQPAKTTQQSQHPHPQLTIHFRLQLDKN